MRLRRKKHRVRGEVGIGSIKKEEMVLMLCASVRGSKEDSKRKKLNLNEVWT